MKASILLPLPLLIAPSTAQELLGTTTGAAGTGFATAIFPVGDLDGDSIGDVLVSFPGVSPSVTVGTGVVRFLSGSMLANGLIMDLVGKPSIEAPAYRPCGSGGVGGGGFGSSTTFGSAIGGLGEFDSIPGLDVLVLTSEEARVGAFNGQFGELINNQGEMDLPCGVWPSFASPLRVNSTGLDDVLIVYSRAESSLVGQAGVGDIGFRLYDGDGLENLVASPVLYDVPAALNSGDGAVEAAAALLGDLDGDGVSDFAIGADRGVNEVQVRSGGDGTLLRSIPTSQADSGFGASVALMGDLDADGVVDIAVGAPAFDLTGANDQSGRVEFISGAWILSPSTATRTLFVHDGQAGDELGKFLVPVNANNDGVLDVLAVGRSTGGPSVSFVMISGRGQSSMWETDRSPVIGGSSQFAVTDAPDGARILVAYSEAATGASGRVDVLRAFDGAGVTTVTAEDASPAFPGGCPCANAGVATIGGCPNSVGTMGVLASEGGSTSLSASSFDLMASAMSPQQAALLIGIYNQGTTVSPLGNGLLLDGTLYRFNPPVLADAQGNANWAGDLLGELNVAAGPTAGDTVSFVAWYRDTGCPGGGASSNLTSTYEIVIQP